MSLSCSEKTSGSAPTGATEKKENVQECKQHFGVGNFES